ncbi:hypothetical protein RF11_13200 [Thelohanellus kitauei]|uniref:Uncharacterized protein n=1 Tax=Thelohanellus kitauei TaxID=669202 RepID=A0A0C2J1K4_THEKT|nr:hypothetical protein RF11_13200 [Thelohanellus kitauei]
MDENNTTQSERVKLQKKVEEIIHVRFRQNHVRIGLQQKFIESLQGLNKDIIKESADLKNDEENQYRMILESLDRFDTKWNTFKNNVDRNLKIFENLSQQTPSDIFSYLKDLQCQLEDELETLRLFYSNFQLVEEDYRLIFEKSAPLKEYLRIINQINKINQSLSSLSKNSYTTFGEKVQNQIKILREKCLAKISLVVKSQLENNDIFKLYADPAFKESIDLIKPNSSLMKNSLLGYLSYRRSYLSRIYHQKFTNQKYRQTLYKMPIDVTTNIENFVTFAFENTVNEFHEVEKLVSMISLDYG